VNNIVLHTQGMQPVDLPSNATGHNIIDARRQPFFKEQKIWPTLPEGKLQPPEWSDTRGKAIQTITKV